MDGAELVRAPSEGSVGLDEIAWLVYHSHLRHGAF